MEYLVAAHHWTMGNTEETWKVEWAIISNVLFSKTQKYFKEDVFILDNYSTFDHKDQLFSPTIQVKSLKKHIRTCYAHKMRMCFSDSNTRNEDNRRMFDEINNMEKSYFCLFST